MENKPINMDDLRVCTPISGTSHVCLKVYKDPLKISLKQTGVYHKKYGEKPRGRATRPRPRDFPFRIDKFPHLFL